MSSIKPDLFNRDRYDVGKYIDFDRSAQTTNPEFNQTIQNRQIQQIMLKNRKIIEGFLEDRKWRNALANKSLAQFFLGRTSNIRPEPHPDYRHVESYMWGSSSFSSMEMINYLIQLKDNPHISEESKEAIEQWIRCERQFLQLTLLFDGWRAQNTELVEFVLSPAQPSLMNVFSPPSLPKEPQKIPAEEKTAFAQAVVLHLKNMLPGQKFKMLSGHLFHEARIILEKTNQDTFDVYYYNAGDGAPVVDGKGRTACVYSDVSVETLTSENFWKKYVKAKMSPNISKMNDLLNTMGPPKESIGEDLTKPQQLDDNCPVQALGGEFKHTFISAHKDNDEGWEQYKLLTSLMATVAKETQKDSVDKELFELLKMREVVRHRYFDWKEISENDEKYEMIKHAYLTALESLGIERNDLMNKIEGKRKIQALQILHQKMNRELDRANFSLEKLEKIRNTFQKSTKLENPILPGFEIHEKTTQSLELLTQHITNMKSAGGFLYRLITPLFPNSWEPLIEQFIAPDNVTPKALPFLFRDALKGEPDEVVCLFLHELYEIDELNGLYDKKKWHWALNKLLSRNDVPKTKALLKEKESEIKRKIKAKKAEEKRIAEKKRRTKHKEAMHREAELRREMEKSGLVKKTDYETIAKNRSYSTEQMVKPFLNILQEEISNRKRGLSTSMTSLQFHTEVQKARGEEFVRHIVSKLLYSDELLKNLEIARDEKFFDLIETWHSKKILDPADIQPLTKLLEELKDHSFIGDEVREQLDRLRKITVS